MVIFKKRGRPTKSEKGLLKNINSLLSSFTDEDKKRFDFLDEKVTRGERLSEIWDSIQDSSILTEAKEKQTHFHNQDIVDTSTGEIIEKEEHNIRQKIVYNKEGVKFDKEEEMEEATIIDEIENESNSGSSNKNAIPASFNPLGQPIQERSYNKQSTASVGDIKEPNFGSTTSVSEELDDMEHEQEEIEKEREQEEEEEKERPLDNLTNESMNDLDSKDKKEASKQLVETVLDTYEMLHDFGKKFVQYPEEKIQEKILNNEIDPSMEIPIDEYGNTTNVTEFFQEFNEQSSEALSYDPKFGEKVRPAMERVFTKKGWGMTDEQFLLIAFAKDAGWKTMQIVNLKKTANGIMDTFVKMQREKIEDSHRQPPSQSVQPDSIVTPPQPPKEQAQPIYQHEHEEDEEDERENESGISVIEQ